MLTDINQPPITQKLQKTNQLVLNLYFQQLQYQIFDRKISFDAHTSFFIHVQK